MLRAEKLVVLSKHVRSLLVHDAHVSRSVCANDDGGDVKQASTLDDEAKYVPQQAPQLNALSSGHGSGF